MKIRAANKPSRSFTLTQCPDPAFSLLKEGTLKIPEGSLTPLMEIFIIFGFLTMFIVHVSCRWRTWRRGCGCSSTGGRAGRSTARGCGTRSRPAAPGPASPWWAHPTSGTGHRSGTSRLRYQLPYYIIRLCGHIGTKAVKELSRSFIVPREGQEYDIWPSSY